MKKVSYFVLFVAMLVLLEGCGRNHESPETVNSDMEQTETVDKETGGETKETSVETDVDENLGSEENRMYITVGNTTMTMTLADNASATAFREMAASGPFTVETKEYGGFEQVGSLSENLPANDEQISTEPGDVMLYQGNSVTIFYGTNSWSYTRLGKIEGMSQEVLREVHPLSSNIDGSQITVGYYFVYNY